MDEAEIFCDFELEKEQEQLGIAPGLVPDSLNNESSSIKSEDPIEKEKDDIPGIPPSPGSSIKAEKRDRKMSDNSVDKVFHVEDRFVRTSFTRIISISNELI